MKHGQRRKSQKEIDEMIELRQQGMAFTEIAERFGLDHTTVVYHWQKHTCRGKTGSKNRNHHLSFEEYNKVREYKRKVDTTIHCPVCELLWTSQYFCDYCKD